MKIHDNRKFDAPDQIEREANRIMAAVKRKLALKDFAAEIVIVISDKDGKTGAPAPLHLHIMIYANPCETVAKLIISIINDFQRKRGFDTAAQKHNFNNGRHIDNYFPYIVNQGYKFRHFRHDPDSILSGLSIKDEIEKINPFAFTKRPSRKTDKDSKATGLRGNAQLPCNEYRTPHAQARACATAEGGAQVGSPGEEKDITTREGKTPFESGRKMLPKKTFRTGSAKHSSSNLWDRDLITPDEWLSLTSREKARYYNNTNMKLSYFAYKMHMTTKTITEDFKRNGYHYDEIDRTFKTIMQRHHDRIRSILNERKMQKNYIGFDDDDL